MTPTELLSALRRAGVTVTLNATRDALVITGAGQPPQALLNTLTGMKDALLTHLTTRRGTRPDWSSVAALPGRCGSCARSLDASATWGAFMVTCTQENRAFWPDHPPLALHVAHRCIAHRQQGVEVGSGYRRKGETHYGLKPPSATDWNDLPSLGDS